MTSWTAYRRSEGECDDGCGERDCGYFCFEIGLEYFLVGYITIYSECSCSGLETNSLCGCIRCNYCLCAARAAKNRSMERSKLGIWKFIFPWELLIWALKLVLIT